MNKHFFSSGSGSIVDIFRLIWQLFIVLFFWKGEGRASGNY